VLQLRLGIDDPLDSSAVHLVNGVMGLLLLSFLAKPHHVALLTGGSCGGIFYSRAGWSQLGIQVLGERGECY
jgi:Amt family ammonium transporter